MSCRSLFIGYAVVVYKFPDKNIRILVVCPLACVYILIVDSLEVSDCDVLSFGYDFNSVKDADARALLSFNQNRKLADEFLAECRDFAVEFIFRNIYLGLLIRLRTFLVAFFCNL